MDERLVGVAFMDVGIHVTSLRAMKNLLVIGDVVKSVWFVAFQARSLLFGACTMLMSLLRRNPSNLPSSRKMW
jgi:hypothetical protein